MSDNPRQRTLNDWQANWLWVVTLSPCLSVFVYPVSLYLLWFLWKLGVPETWLGPVPELEVVLLPLWFAVAVVAFLWGIWRKRLNPPWGAALALALFYVWCIMLTVPGARSAWEDSGF